MTALKNALDELAHISQTDTTEARAELAAIIAAGNKLAEVAKNYESIDDLYDAIGEWEAANK